VYDQGEKEYRAAATGMALLPFLAAGETHKPGKKGEERKYQKVVSNGLTALTKMCPKDGKTAGRISTNMYVQALATLALCEAYGMTRDADLKPFAQAAIDFLQTAQGPNGSWSYGANANGDLSIVGWQVQALHAAKLGGLEVNDAVIQKAVKFLNLAAGGPKKSMYGYNDSAGAAPGTSLTAVGLLCRYYLDDWQPDHAGLADGLAGLAKVPPVGQGNVRNMYYYYYATQVMRNAGGESWTNWNEGKLVDGARKSGLRDWLVAQQRKKDGADMGSWDPEGGWFGVSCGRLGTTAMCVLTLQVYYRSYPLYMPDAKGKLVKITDAK
jgi:hypothetical protein